MGYAVLPCRRLLGVQTGVTFEVTNTVSRRMRLRQRLFGSRRRHFWVNDTLLDPPMASGVRNKHSVRSICVPPKSMDLALGVEYRQTAALQQPNPGEVESPCSWNKHPWTPSELVQVCTSRIPSL